MIKNLQLKEWFHNNKDHQRNEIVKVLGVEYAHLKLNNEDDLYLTKHGLPFIEHLLPKNFLTDREWFNKNSARLSGTSCIYKVRTKKVQGIHKDVVLKWNRMGQEIPGLGDCEKLMCAEFNSPFEEFSLVMELRNGADKNHNKIIIQNPMAIYVPFESVELWQTGRKEYRMHQKIRTHQEEIELDMFRSYAVIYEWIEGLDAVQACNKGIINEKHMKRLTLDSEKKLKEEGFIVRDSKPHHVIVKPGKDGTLAQNEQGETFYALVDFELLERTPEREAIIKKDKRLEYLKRQRDRFNIETPEIFHPHLRHVNIFGVDYIYGHVESTQGRLWVVGKDPYLFDYFLPERWEQTPKTKISMSSELYYTVTKDKIHLVWEVSKVGLQPDMDPFKEDEKKISDYGHNSPFEEVSLAIELSNKDLATIYPRAIYMTGNKTEISENLFDNSRYESHKNIVTPDGMPILKANRNYIIIWGYWNGPDEKLAAKDGDYYEGINVLRAYRDGIITQEEYISLLQVAKDKLSCEGIEDLNLRGNHLLISLDNTGNLIVDNNGRPELRICNFEFLKRIYRF